ncbi:MAG: 4-hydroxy-tetrahydrodipicolinate reductase [Candidatus Levyibacteriota bacterium]|nr:MAG: 4-hydroxy-tetrahydrodipicolinate reductase [Candidatus Levybacteria bacterium]
MKIALIGHGNMGQEIHTLLKEDNKHEIVSVSYKNITDKLDINTIKKADVAIDFTSADIVLDTIEKVASQGINLVVGTTGWYDKLSDVEKIVKKTKIGLIFGKNFSLGANIFFQIVGFSAKLFAKYGKYDVAGFEMHHTGKKDSPSGTAKKLAAVIMENFPKKKTLETGRLDRQIREDELHFASIRAGRNFGYHEVLFDSQADEVKLSHAAHSRRGFAEGAILAAQYIKGKKGIYGFEDSFLKGVIK